MEDRTFDRISRSLASATSRRQAIKLLGGGIAATALGASGVIGLSQVATAQTANPLTVPIAGTGELGSFLGTFTLDRVIARAGQLVGLGTLAGTLTTTLTGATREISRAVQLPLAAAGTCKVLDLTLGPLDLNLLGLRIQLNQIHLLITAQQGGGLLGDLLCSLSGLLSGGGALRGIRNLLNQILGILG